MKLNSYIAKVQPSVTLAISEEAKRLERQGISVVNFSKGEPNFGTPDFIKKAGIEAISSEFTKYTPVSGILELKEAICSKLKKDNCLDYDVSQIVVSCGAKHSIFNVIQVLCEAGDEVIIPAPYWVSYPEMVRLAGAKPIIVPCREEDSFKVSPELLEKAITNRTKLIILNSPSNPTGMVYSEKELSSLAKVLSQTEAFVLSDEIYEHIIYEKKHISPFYVLPELKNRGILINGHSKAYAMTGWRIGYMAAPTELCRAVSMYQSHGTSNPCSISQKAALAALLGDQSCLTKNRAIFQKRRDILLDRFNAIDEVSCSKPDGAFYVFPNVKKLIKRSSVELCQALLNEARIAVVPGDAFGAPDYIRFSYALDLEDIKEGMSRFEKWIRTKFNR